MNIDFQSVKDGFAAVEGKFSRVSRIPAPDDFRNVDNLVLEETDKYILLIKLGKTLDSEEIAIEFIDIVEAFKFLHSLILLRVVEYKYELMSLRMGGITK